MNKVDQSVSAVAKWRQLLVGGGLVVAAATAQGACAEAAAVAMPASIAGGVADVTQPQTTLSVAELRAAAARERALGRNRKALAALLTAQQRSEGPVSYTHLTLPTKA